MTFYRICILFVSLLFTAQINAQFWLSNEDIYNEAEEFIDAEEYIEALPLYQLLEKKEVINDNIRYKIGLCFLNIEGKKLKAIPYLETASKNTTCNYTSALDQSQAPVKSMLLLGVAYRMNYQFDKAIKTFYTLKDSLQLCDTSYITIANWHIDRCLNAKQMYKHHNAYNKELLKGDVNNQYSNYAPIVTNNGNTIFYMNELKFYDALMMAEKKDSSYIEKQNLTPVIGSDGDHILVGASSNGDKLFLYNFTDYNTGDLFITEYIDNAWTKVRNIDSTVINSPFNETYASFCDADSTLYFTSNRTGSIGGADIYKSKLVAENKWSAPENLGNTINTIYNEAAPFYLESEKKLFFSSQGHLSMGGYDIFYSQLDSSGHWQEPVNIGYPGSTPDDDIYFYPINTQEGYIAQYLPSETEQYDIFKITREKPSEEKLYALEFDFSNNDELRTYDTIDIDIVELTNNDTVASDKVIPRIPYKALVPFGDYQIKVASGSKSLASSSVQIAPNLPIDNISIMLNEDEPPLYANASAQTATSDTAQDAEELQNKVAEKVKVVLGAEKTAEKISVEQKTVIDTLILYDILFSFDSYAIEQQYLVLVDSVAALLKKTKGNVEIQGHTDNFGPSAYNIYLSEKRANAVERELVNRDVEKSQISTVAKGEEAPICLNTKTDGSDNLLGRKYNRRVTLKIIEVSNKVVVIYKKDIPEKLLLHNPTK